MCGRCGQVWHVVMAKMGDKIAKVVCKRCGGHHRYRDENADASGGDAASRPRRPTFGSARRSRTARDARAAGRAAVRSREAAARVRRARQLRRRRAGRASDVRRRRRRRLAGRGQGRGRVPRAARACSPAPRSRRRWRVRSRRRICRSARPPAEVKGVARASTLRKRLERAIRGGHPWIYRDALAGAPRLRDGAVVLVTTRRRAAAGASVSGTRARRSRCASWRRAPPRRTPARAGRRSARGGAGAPAGVHRPPPDRRLPLDSRRGRRAAGRSRRRLRPAPRAFAATASGARAFYRDLPERLRATAARLASRCGTVVERRRARGGADAPTARHGPRSRCGAAPDGEIEVRENGLRFGVDLLRGQKGGLFLDQRDNRALVRTLAPGRRVLNLFGYTGGFSIYAAAGGARATVTVDVGRAGHRGGAPQLRAQRPADRRRALRRRGRVRVPRARGARRRALRPGDLRPAQLRAQPPRARRRACAPTGGCTGCARPSPRRAARCARRPARATSTATAFLATVRDGARDAGRRVRAARAARRRPPTTRSCRNFPRATT